MQLITQPPKKALNKAYLKEKVSRSDIELFKKNLSILLSKINELEREEHHKYPFSDFLKNTWYRNQYEINTKGDFDFVIHDGKSSKDPVGALIEVKRPSKSAEMISKDKPNVKAFHELILYYLRERIDEDNKDIKHLIVTNIYEWYIIDEKWFEENVYRNVKLRKDYDSWKLSGKDTRFFYESVAKPFLEAVKHDITATWFDLREYQKAIIEPEKTNENKLIALYKILSPEHILKRRISNDNNSLDTKFYTELLHIIGLEETEDGGKKIISRKRLKDSASLIENTVMKLEDKDCLSNIPYLTTYGDNLDEQLETIALELSITWINRILFLKLLEAQLSKYHYQDTDYQFLNSHIIADFNELNDLFFLVLAERPNTRRPHIQDKFGKIPYLNSSLFERTELEKKTLEISDLDSRFQLNILSDTVLTGDTGKKRVGSLQTIRYLFEFLNAYDFSSEGSEEIQEGENKRLISASVLGLIFEKINGYKDGSFFTPSFITMYMCREAIQRKIIEKFNTEFNINCGTLNDLRNYTSGHYKTDEILKFNAVIDNLTLCDPAVGSGHFLVSALNEILFLKAELGILSDEMGVRLGGYEMKLENDELILTYNDNTEIFEYKVLDGHVNKDVQRVQKTIFNEKQKIIENSLFGVDINPNSVKICSLRLWIELLKSAYYTDESNFTELETLPNIDINIKHGNSLVKKFSLDVDLSEAFKNTNTIKIYKEAVNKYKSTNDKQEKARIREIIEGIKSKFKDKLDKEFLTKISRARGKVIKLEADINSKKQWKEVISPALESKFLKAKASLDKTKSERDAIIENVNYKDAFEWRFEFPEVLDSEYNFTGFDIVIGNPPYGVKLSEDAQKLLKRLYDFGTTETAILFIKHGFDILKKGGIQTYIVPKSFSFASNYSAIRGFTLPYLTTLVDCGKVWADVKLEVCIFELEKSTVSASYRNLVRTDQVINYSTTFEKELVTKYGFLLNNISQNELLLSEKILTSSVFLNEVATNRRGEGLQQRIKENGKVRCLGGIDIARFGIKGFRGYISEHEYNNVSNNAKISDNGILVQNIVAHITTPYPHTKIIASLPDSTDYVLLDTINQITVNSSKYSKYIIWALLNSTIVNWFVYLFIYGKAIRTMHFDNVITSRLPVPAEFPQEVSLEINSIGKKIEERKADDAELLALQEHLDELIFNVYNLSDDEISCIRSEKTNVEKKIL